ncbi:transcriptional regulator [Vibrio diazotrophicus]|nr:transcriptional regulator [Vibrio diazotrophicus]
MSIDKKKALKKIAKCLELGNSANVNEAANAIKMAHRLMLKYGLDKDDIEFIKLGKTQSSNLLPASISSGILRIIRGINTKFGVEAVLINHKGLKRVEFIGEADRAIFAAFAFDIVYREMNEHTGQFRNSFAGSGTSTLEVNRRVGSFVSGWIEGALEKLPVISPDEDSANKINDYIDKEFKNVDRETFKQQLREAMKNLTADYEVGLKKGRRVSVNRPINGAQAPKLLK